MGRGFGGEGGGGQKVQGGGRGERGRGPRAEVAAASVGPSALLFLLLLRRSGGEPRAGLGASVHGSPRSPAPDCLTDGATPPPALARRGRRVGPRGFRGRSS